MAYAWLDFKQSLKHIFIVTINYLCLKVFCAEEVVFLLLNRLLRCISDVKVDLHISNNIIVFT